MHDELKKEYEIKKKEIKSRINDFKTPKTDNDILSELCFCLLTPQSKAKICWNAVLKLKEKGLLHSGDAETISLNIKDVRFRNNKLKYIITARDNFKKIKEKIMDEKDSFSLRDWLVQNVKGYGYKEASHFLRNIGFLDVAILDRHILNNLVKYGIIEKIPTLTKKNYMETEGKMKKFANDIGIPFAELDLLFWYMGNGEIFK